MNETRMMTQSEMAVTPDAGSEIIGQIFSRWIAAVR